VTLSTRTGYHGSSIVNTRPRPVPVPRSTGQRRVRVGGVALACMLLALGAALSGIALLSVSHTGAYLAVAQRVVAGNLITPGALRTVRLPDVPGLDAMPATEIDSVIGKFATVTLFPGALLIADEFTGTPGPPGMDQVSIPLPPGGLPAPDLQPGERILLYPRNGATEEYTGIVISVGTAGGGGVNLYLAVAPNQTHAISTLSATVGFSAALAPPGR
jgi:hypothetical protein